MHSLEDWQHDELDAFLTLHRLEGRHIIIRLFNNDNPHQFRVKDVFMRDLTLDKAASYDIAVLYRLLTPVNSGAVIPGGDAFHGGEGSPDTRGVTQTAQMRALSQMQSANRAERAYFNQRTGGKAENTLTSLMRDVIEDNASTFDLVMQPEYGCRVVELRPVDITPAVMELRIFGPTAVQMIPEQSSPIEQ